MLACKVCRGHYEQRRRHPDEPLKPLRLEAGPTVVISTRVSSEAAKLLTKQAALTGTSLYVHTSKVLEEWAHLGVRKNRHRTA